MGRSNSNSDGSGKQFETIQKNIRSGIKEWMEECKGKSALSVLNAIYARVSLCSEQERIILGKEFQDSKFYIQLMQLALSENESIQYFAMALLDILLNYFAKEVVDELVEKQQTWIDIAEERESNSSATASAMNLLNDLAILREDARLKISKSETVLFTSLLLFIDKGFPKQVLGVRLLATFSYNNAPFSNRVVQECPEVVSRIFTLTKTKVEAKNYPEVVENSIGLLSSLLRNEKIARDIAKGKHYRGLLAFLDFTKDTFTPAILTHCLNCISNILSRNSNSLEALLGAGLANSLVELLAWSPDNEILENSLRLLKKITSIERKEVFQAFSSQEVFQNIQQLKSISPSIEVHKFADDLKRKINFSSVIQEVCVGCKKVNSEGKKYIKCTLPCEAVHCSKECRTSDKNHSENCGSRIFLNKENIEKKPILHKFNKQLLLRAVFRPADEFIDFAKNYLM